LNRLHQPNTHTHTHTQLEGRSALEPLLSSRPKRAEDLARRLAIGDVLLAHGCPIVSRNSLLELVLQWVAHHGWMQSSQGTWHQEVFAHEALEWLFGRAGWPTLAGSITDLDTVRALVSVSSPRIMALMVAHGLDLNQYALVLLVCEPWR
jgi:hypothetical protein